MAEVMDEFTQKLKGQMQALQQCQQERSQESCLNCSEVMECELRHRYIQAVYESMSKGQTGGFDF